MRKRIILWSCLLLFAGKTATGQEAPSQNQWHHSLFVQFGPSVIFPKAPTLERLRPQGWNAHYFHLDSDISVVQLGTIYEMMAPNGHWAFRSGLQYSFSSKHIDGSDDEGFLFQVDNESQYEYLRVKSISQQSHYLGIPIEVRRYLLPPDKGFRLFVLAQANFDFLLDNKNSVEFCNEAMTPYAGEVVCHYDDPSTMLIHPYIGFGLRAGKKDKIGVCFSWMTHFGDIYGNRSLLDATSGIKSQIELHIPIK